MADGGAGGPGRSGARREAVTWSPQVAEAICARVAAGGSLSALEREAGFPTRTAVSYWRRTRPDFAERLGAAQKRARLAARVADREAEAARLVQPRRRDGGRKSTYTPAIGEAICERLADGQSVIAIARDPAMPCAGTIYRWLQRHADFQEMYVEAREAQGDDLFDEAREVGLAATPKTVWVARLQFDIIRWQTARLAPRKYVEKLVVAQVKLEPPEPQTVTFHAVHFEIGPNGKVLAVPPRSAEEAAKYEAAHGRAYDGPWGAWRPDGA